MEFTDDQIRRMDYDHRRQRWKAACEQLPSLPWDQREAAVEQLRRLWQV